VTIGGGDAVEIGERVFLCDTASAALVAADGTIDWWCPRRFDAPATLYRMLDPRGGAVRVGPEGPAHAGTQTYEEGALTSRTIVRGRDSQMLIRDVMPWDGGNPPGRIVRLITVLQGPADVVIDVVPGRSFGPARDVSAWSEGVTFDGTAVRTGTPMRVGLEAVAGARGRILLARGRLCLEEGDHHVLTIDPPPDGGRPITPLSPDQAMAVFDRTAAAWRRVLAPAAVDGPWAALAGRSLLVLRALSLVSAPTTSLPEVEGGERTTEGRVVRTSDVASWASVADATGLAEEASAAVGWLVAVLDSTEVLSDVLGVDGDPPPSERELPLAGWRGSQPVRVGHDAPDHPSVETACAVLAAAAALADRPPGAELLDRWERLVTITDWVARHWADGDDHAAPRLVARHALAAMARVAWQRNPLDVDAAGWHRQRMAAEADLLAHAASHRGALDDGQDAAALQVTWHGPWPAQDPVVSATLAASRSRLSAGAWLLHHASDIESRRAASVVATLWQVRALALTGRWEEANLGMERVAALAGPLGLLPEFVDSTTSQARGNRPCAAAHLAFVEAALALAAGPR
jgi:hypothetical protein